MFQPFSPVKSRLLILIAVLAFLPAAILIGSQTTPVQACSDAINKGCPDGPFSLPTIKTTINNSQLAFTIGLDNGRLVESELRDFSTKALIAKGDQTENGPGVFRIVFLQPGTGQEINVGAPDFIFQKSDPESSASVTLSGVSELVFAPLKVQITYSLMPGTDFLQTQLTVEAIPNADGWVISRVETARFRAAAAYNRTKPGTVLDSALYYQKRWVLPPDSTPGNWMNTEDGRGLYNFSNSPFGREYFQDDNLMVLDQFDHQPLSQGFQSGQAVVGYYSSGGPEIGYSRFVNYITRYVSRMSRQNKQAPVFFNTWIPWTNRIDQNVIQKAIGETQQAGYYDVLHIDAGWEGTFPLQIDTKKFPGGLDAIQQKARQKNLALSLWINPYSDSYFGYVNYESMHRAERDWHVPLTEGYLPAQGFNRGAFQVLSPYSDYVEQKLTDLVSRYDLKMIYWDGADWNIRDSEVDFLDNAARQRLKVLGMKRLMQITDRLYSIRPDLVLVSWNAWVDPHLLSIFDQEQVTDMFTAPLGLAELARRKTYYAMSYIMPFGTIWSDWYGLTYNERKDDFNLYLPENQLEYAELSMLSKGLKEAGGSIDQNQARPALKSFLQNLFSFRKRFDRYFDVYQRLSEAPDANRADASGHLINGKGFILLNNPTNLYQQLSLSLNPQILGLKPGQTYKIYDWSDLKHARNYSSLSFASNGRPSSLSQSLPPRSVRILSIDLDDNSRDLIPAQNSERN